MDKNRQNDVTKIAYQLPQPAGVISDIFVAELSTSLEGRQSSTREGKP